MKLNKEQRNQNIQKTKIKTQISNKELKCQNQFKTMIDKHQ